MADLRRIELDLPGRDGRPVQATCAVHHPGGARAAVAIHGFRGDHHGLALVADALDLTVYVPDLPGFGRTGELAHRHDLVGFTEFVGSFIGALQLPDPPMLIGHSFGTIVSAAFAADNAGAIDSLVLINPISVLPTSGPRRAATAVAVGFYRLGAALPEPLGRRLLAARVSTELMSLMMMKTAQRPLRRFIRDQHNRYFSAFGSRRALLEAFEVSTTRTVSESADRLTMPTLVIAGQRDDLASVADQRELARRIPDARLVVIGGVGHLSHYEAPERLARAIAEFRQHQNEAAPLGAGNETTR